MSEELFDKVKAETLDIVNKWKESRPKKWHEFFTFTYHVADDLIQLVEVSKDIVNGPDKKATVVEAVKYAYNEVDPDLPWIPEPIESKIEKWMLENGVPTLIDFLVSRYNKYGVFNKNEDGTADTPAE